MGKIRIDCGVCNGHTNKQMELTKVIEVKIRELWPDIQKTGSSTGCWHTTEWNNEEVSYSFEIDSSD